MKPTIPQSIVLTVGLLAGAPLLGQAQTPPAPTNPRSPVTSATIVTIPPASSYKTTNPNAEIETESITTLLNLAASRIAQLDRAYTTYARARLVQEAQIAQWQDELRTAQGATTFDERKATQLAGSVSGSENKIATAYLKARGEALAALTLAQRTQLEKIEAENRPIRDDKYRFLLLSQVEDLWRVPIDAETSQALVSAAGAPKSAPVQQNYYYNTQPAYNYPLYSYGFGGNDYSYGFGSPFYARPNYYGGFYGSGGYYGTGYYGNGGSYYNNNRYNDYNRVDLNARPRWDRTDNNSRPPVPTYTSPIPRSPEPRRPLYAPQNPSSNGSGSVPRPVPVPPQPQPQPQPQWERQRETPRQPESRPDPPRVEPTRPDPPRADPPRSNGGGNSDGGSRWNRGGGGRGR